MRKGSWDNERSLELRQRMGGEQCQLRALTRGPHSAFGRSLDALNSTSKIRAFKSRNLSRLFPLLSSLRHSKKLKSEWTREFRGNVGEREFVILVFISYEGWKRRTKTGKLEDIELQAVRNDPKLLLDHLNFRHNDASRDWYFIMDFDLEYTDRAGVTKILPRTMPEKDALLRTVREATRKGGSGFIHIAAHCHNERSGTSDLKTKGQTVIYSENPHKNMGRKAAYFISSDGQRVYGKELYPCLSDDYDVGRDETLTLSLDMCNASAFLKNDVNLSRLTTSQSNTYRTTASEQARRRRQLVLICSSQSGQVAGALYNRAGYQGLFGAATSLMIERFQGPAPSPAELVKYLNDICSTRPEKHLRQTPSIASRYPIWGPLRLLPSPTTV